MKDNNEQDVCMNPQSILIKGSGFINSSDIVLQSKDFFNSYTVDSFIISESQCKIMEIDEELYIKQWNVKSLKRDFKFKSMQKHYFPIRQLKYTKNNNYFYYDNSRFQIRFMQVNNGKVKQISKMKKDNWYFVRQILVDDENFIFIAIPSFIQQYCKFTKKLIKLYSIQNSYGQDCFDCCVQRKLLVSQDHKNIKVWFIKEKYMINRQHGNKWCMNIHIKLNKRQIYTLTQGSQDQVLMLCIYQITNDNTEIIPIISKQIDNFMQYICTIYSLEDVYTILQKYDQIRWDCQAFSILQKDSQYKYLAIINKQISISEQEFQQKEK